MEEESKSEAPKKLEISEVVDKEAKQVPWLAFLDQDGGKANELIKSTSKAFLKFNAGLIFALKTLEGREEKKVDLKDIAQMLAKEDNEVMLAILLQNLIHCKNHLRTEAIQNGTYRVFLSK